MREKEKTKKEQQSPEKTSDTQPAEHTTQRKKESGHGMTDKEKTTKTHKKDALGDTLTELQGKIAEINDKYLRLYSEFDNFRKRTLREKIELTKIASQEVIFDLLPVLDDFDRAIKHSEDTDNVEAVKEGQKLILAKFKTILEQKGLKEIKSIGEPFDIDLHDAIASVPSPSEDMRGKIIEETVKGYMLNGKVIRYAKVVVGS